tara:strand:- start:208 stop:528 length:321 start_codon:yes stop_codon:yes gene_type:complete
MSSVEEIIAEGGTASFPNQHKRGPKMAYEIEEGQVSVFANDKGDNPKRPDFTGKGLFDGKEFQISLWKSTSKNGLEYWSGRISEPYNGAGSGDYSGSSASVDDVPW